MTLPMGILKAVKPSGALSRPANSTYASSTARLFPPRRALWSETCGRSAAALRAIKLPFTLLLNSNHYDNVYLNLFRCESDAPKCYDSAKIVVLQGSFIIDTNAEYADCIQDKWGMLYVLMSSWGYAPGVENEYNITGLPSDLCIDVPVFTIDYHRMALFVISLSCIF